jgi:hypothetical protein
MNNPRDAYNRNALRVARLLAWLEVELERHGERAADFDEPVRLWPMAGRLAYIENELTFVLMLLSSKTEKKINQALKDGGQDNE